MPDIPSQLAAALADRYTIERELGRGPTNVLEQQRFQMFGGSVIGRRVLAGMTSTC